ncbi:MAG: DUF4389 domain-containing protein [Chloroflexi bacterium]|nr:DUF4389 domain-containing protein [Chloroflexota bacterium]
MAQPQESYPVRFSVDYPDRPLNRLSSAFRIFAIIPIGIIFFLVSSGSLDMGDRSDGGLRDISLAAGGVGGWVFFAVVLMILFRQKYPRWWFDWNFALQRFENRVLSYLLLLRDEYPSTDEEQAVHLDIAYPDVKTDLNRWLPLVKWLLALPHYIVLVVLSIAGVVVAVVAWFAILFTGRYPRDPFDFLVGVMRWYNRVGAYMALLATDKYPPFRLAP